MEIATAFPKPNSSSKDLSEPPFPNSSSKDLSDSPFPIYEFRLPSDIGQLRYDNGKWTKNDGEYDLCFIEKGPFVHYIDLPYQENVTWCLNKWNLNNRNHHWCYQHFGPKEKFIRWETRDSHPNILASRQGMDFCSSQHGVANGRGIRFTVDDPYILNFCVREKLTKKVLLLTRTIDCIDCGKYDWVDYLENHDYKRFKPVFFHFFWRELEEVF